MFAWFKSLFITVDSIVNIHIVDDREDEDIMVHERIFMPCPTCKRSMVMGYTHKH